MQPPSDPRRLLAEWRSLTEREGEAIDAGDWDLVLGLQASKAALRDAFPPSGGHAASSGDPSEADRLVWQAVIGMESRNLERLARHRAAAEAERAAVEKSRSDLRRLHQRFVMPLGPGWQRYS